MLTLTDTDGRTVVTPTASENAVSQRRRGLARISQLFDYAFWLLYTFLFLRLLLVFFHANPAAPFTRFIGTVSNPFYRPFRSIVSSETVNGGFTLAVPILVGMAAYLLLHVAINKLLRLLAYRRTTL